MGLLVLPQISPVRNGEGKTDGVRKEALGRVEKIQEGMEEREREREPRFISVNQSEGD